MELIHPQCAGLDVHQKTVVACARLAAAGVITHEVHTFGATTAGVAVRGITHVAMESTGVFWKPVRSRGARAT